MEPISHEKRLEIARYYLLGSVYAEIEKKTGVSHGTVVNVVKELETGQLTVPEIPLEEVNDLHLLSLDLVKKGLKPSQALLGVTLFERFSKLGIVPSEVDQWSEMVKKYAPDDFTAKDFYEAALHLHKLEEAEKKPFQDVAKEYAALDQKVVEMGSEVDSLKEQKKEVAVEVESLESEINTLKSERDEVKVLVETASADLEKSKLMVTAAKNEHAQLTHEIDDLQKSKLKLCSEVDGKEKLLAALKEMGFSEEDLLHLRNLVEGMAAKEGASPDQVKDRFFSALGQFGDLSGLQKATQEEAEALQNTIKLKATLTGEVGELENRRALLQVEIGKSATAAAGQIRAASSEAVAIIQNDTDVIRQELKHILEDTLLAGLAVGEASASQKKSEKAGKELGELISEVKRRLGGKQ